MQRLLTEYILYARARINLKLVNYVGSVIHTQSLKPPPIEASTTIYYILALVEALLLLYSPHSHAPTLTRSHAHSLGVLVGGGCHIMAASSGKIGRTILLHGY